VLRIVDGEIAEVVAFSPALAYDPQPRFFASQARLRMTRLTLQNDTLDTSE
jgi:hypothetical protein